MGDSLTKIRTASSPNDTISKDTRALCLGCGRDRLSRVRRYRTKTRHGNDIFHASWLCICDDCGLVQAMPRPDIQQLMNYYAVDYREGCCAGADVADPTRFPKDNLFYYNRGQSAAELIASFEIHLPRLGLLAVLMTRSQRTLVPYALAVAGTGFRECVVTELKQDMGMIFSTLPGCAYVMTADWFRLCLAQISNS